MTRPTEPDATVVLVGGHESGNGEDLCFVPDFLPGSLVTPAGRPLHNLLTRLLGRSRDADGSVPQPVVVLPMTFGRNPTLVADTAKTLRWLGTGDSNGDAAAPLALADAFGTGDHLTAWLRTAAVEVRRRSAEAAMLITADAANPFDDAELYRITHLVRTHGAGVPVETAAAGSAAGLLEAVRRLRLLGSKHTIVVPAGFRRTPVVSSELVPYGSGDFSDTEFYGGLLSERAVLRVIGERVRDALHALSHGRTGVEAGLQADHGHGYAHSHAFEESVGHSHPHSHGTGASHPHSHPAPIGRN
ncbi:cobalamin biosynthesis protein CbiX [Arthrobacter sp. Edens01]|uniref:cobalamin biosynthesis protein CbiX n=1 Tax=Arthrobacter sp. Edens01 TaxID=1732020 RepID=UPI00128EDBF0|nr:cobalamin biosynthesis protein CbiX [Arthrobacter sp. Edens01]